MFYMKRSLAQTFNKCVFEYTQYKQLYVNIEHGIAQHRGTQHVVWEIKESLLKNKIHPMHIKILLYQVGRFQDSQRVNERVFVPFFFSLQPTQYITWKNIQNGNFFINIEIYLNMIRIKTHLRVAGFLKHIMIMTLVLL